jgi:cytoskeletal protein CcmA (bactofilin family)
MADRVTEYGTIIGPDASFKGDFKFDSAAKVMGSIEGSIHGKGVIHIGDGCKCKAAIAAKEVLIEGVVEGNVEAGDRVELKLNGRITGDIVAAKMSMSDGASIDGYCRIGTNGKASSTTEMKFESQNAPAGSPARAVAAKK